MKGNYLGLSLSRLSSHTQQVFADKTKEFFGFQVVPHAHGFMVWLPHPDIPHSLTDYNQAPELRQIFTFAEQQECNLILFDEDYNTLTELPLFDSDDDI